MTAKQPSLCVGVFLFSATATLAHAQSTESIGSITSAANTGTDQSMAALTQVFGSVMSSPLTGSSGSGSTIASIFGTINACVLVIGALWACYLFFAAMIATGAEGEFLGQKRSSIWFTIRNGVGFTLLVPFTGGYSGAQLIMLWVTMMGIGIANLGMSTATSVLANGGTLVSTPPPPQVVSLAKALFEANLCAQAANTAVTNAQVETGGAVTAAEVQQERFNPQTATGQVVLMNSNGLSCGGASVMSNSSSSATTASTSTTGLSSIVPDTSQITSTIAAQQQSALTTMQTTLATAAQAYVTAVLSGPSSGSASQGPPDPQTTINGAASAYQSTIQSAISSASSSISSISSTIQSSLSTSGWVMLGAWYQAFAMANSQLTAAAATTATAIPSTDLSNLPYPDVYNEVMASYNQQIEQDASTTASSTSSSSSTTPVIGLYSNSPDPAHLIGSIFPGQRLVSMVTTLITSNSSSGTGTNPLMGMKTMGDYILDAGDGALAAYAVVSYGQGATDSVPGKVLSAVGDMFSGGAISGLSRVVSNLSPIILMMIVSLFFFGAMLSVYLPMLPFMIWFGGVLSWFACVCEGVVAAPLWAFAHLDGEGEGMGPRTSYGYIFLVNLMLRPVFMVIGFLLASVGVVAFGQLLNTMFAQAMANAQFSSVTGLVSIIAYIVLYVGMCQTLCQAMFGLIHHIPNIMGPWLGTSMHNQFGHEMHDKGHTVLAGASNTSSQHVQRGIGGGKPKGDAPANPVGSVTNSDTP